MGNKNSETKKLFSNSKEEIPQGHDLMIYVVRFPKLSMLRFEKGHGVIYYSRSKKRTYRRKLVDKKILPRRADATRLGSGEDNERTNI